LIGYVLLLIIGVPLVLPFFTIFSSTHFDPTDGCWRLMTLIAESFIKRNVELTEKLMATDGVQKTAATTVATLQDEKQGLLDHCGQLLAELKYLKSRPGTASARASLLQLYSSSTVAPAITTNNTTSNGNGMNGMTSPISSPISSTRRIQAQLFERHRQQQQAMAIAVATASNTGRHDSGESTHQRRRSSTVRFQSSLSSPRKNSTKNDHEDDDNDDHGNDESKENMEDPIAAALAIGDVQPHTAIVVRSATSTLPSIAITAATSALISTNTPQRAATLPPMTMTTPLPPSQQQQPHSARRARSPTRLSTSALAARHSIASVFQTYPSSSSLSTSNSHTATVTTLLGTTASSSISSWNGIQSEHHTTPNRGRNVTRAANHHPNLQHSPVPPSTASSLSSSGSGRTRPGSALAAANEFQKRLARHPLSVTLSYIPLRFLF
jgi:hypothetical protein